MAEFAANPNLLSLIKEAPLVGFESKQNFKGADLWKSCPALIMVVRRPGCSLCRAQAKELASLRPRLAELGINLIAVSHQDNSAAEFMTEYFGKSPGQLDGLYLDPTKAFYKALGGGVERKRSLMGLFSSRMWSNKSAASKLGISGNLQGDYSHLGGVMLVGKGSEGVKWYFQEIEFGDKAPIESMMKACSQSVGK